MIGLILSFVQAPEVKNETTLLEQFPMVKKSDGIDLKLLAMYLSVEQDLLTDCVFESGFDVTATQVVAPIDAMNRAMKQPEASTVAALTDAATDAAMPMLRAWIGYAPPAATKLLQPLLQVKLSLLAAAANSFVFLTAFVMKHGFIAGHRTMVNDGPFYWGICSKQQGPLLLVKLQPAAAMTLCQT